MTRRSEPRLLFYGLGPIGLSTLRYADARRDMRIVGGVDINPALAGRDLGEAAGLGRDLGIAVSSALDEVRADSPPNVVILCTQSRISEVEGQIMALVAAGMNVVSTCEELSYPYRHHGDAAQRIHTAAVAQGVTVLGTGVNPGFVMDLLPTLLSTVCLRVDAVHVRRVVDAGTRRGPLQAKVGAGLSEQEFAARAEAGTLGHKGFVESVALIADALCLPVDRITNEVRPRLVERSVAGLAPGQVAGIDQTARGYAGNEALITLRLLMYVGAHDPRDRIIIQGDPEIRVTLEGGTPGDQATAAAVLNAVVPVVEAPPGLVTVNQLPVLCWRRPD